MTAQLGLFEPRQKYPDVPGFKARSTSHAAAAAIEPRAATLRAKVLALFEGGRRWTPDEAAAELGESILNVRPRFTELNAKGLIEDSGARGRTASGSSCIRWVRR